MKRDTASLLVVLSEFLFVLLPIVIVSMFLLLQSSIRMLPNRTDWSFAAIVLFGQSVVKFTSGMAKSSKKKKWQLISLTTSLILVFGVMPSVVLLIKLLQTDVCPGWVYAYQIINFIFSATIFIVIGTVGQMNLDENN